MVYKLMIRQYNFTNNRAEVITEYVLAENKKELWSYIGYLYSNSICEIERIDYSILLDGNNYKEYILELYDNKIIDINKKLKRYEKKGVK